MVVQSEDNILQPGFICTSGNSSSGIQTSLSTAITIAYNTIFKTKTTFSGPAIIVVSRIEDNTFNGFVSSLITRKGKNKDRNEFKFHYEDKSALEVWKKTKILAKYYGINPFGYLHSSVIQERLTKSIVTCSSQHWLSIEKLDTVFNRHIKSRKLSTSNMLNCYSLVFNWLKEGHSIIRLDKALQSIYLPTYQLQDKDICAWKAILNAYGYTNITLFTKDISYLEFWTSSKNPTINWANFKKLYKNKMLDLNFMPPIPIPITNNTDIIFWEAFKQLLSCNKSSPYN
ncbi:hypothetical protein C2G38_2185821 [Gigaspora rosea]|uniref:Uncharacterized protein n=1 Tax=Gigaspora rosea TaxID=44941 RepID=A0A397VAN9_9GLOM|nr:hypothetical protein C2G38_2185821 [Gigaspora rosea]